MKIPKRTVPLPPWSGSKTQIVHAISNKQSKGSPKVLAEVTMHLIKGLIQGWHRPYPFPSPMDWCGLLEAWWSQQVVAEVKFKNEFSAKVQSALFYYLVWYHSRMELFDDCITCTTVWWERQKLATLGYSGSPLVDHFLHFLYWARLTVTKNRTKDLRDRLSVRWGWRQEGTQEWWHTLLLPIMTSSPRSSGVPLLWQIGFIWWIFSKKKVQKYLEKWYKITVNVGVSIGHKSDDGSLNMTLWT